MTKDYYDILGVDKNATQDEIKQAYKKLAKKYHPDISKEEGAEQKFKEVNEAAAILGDPQKRKHYDQFGTAGEQFSGNWQDFAQGFPFEDIFESLFGRGFGGFGGFGTRQRGTPGRDLLAEIDLTLKEAAKGVTKKVKLQRLTSCEECSGKGGTGLVTCSTCNGQGVVQQTRRTPFGMFATRSTCKQCQGSGETVQNVCKECGGEGRLVDREPVSVKIPAGIFDGMKVRLAGEGDAGTQGAPHGDLYVQVNVEDDERFIREGSNLHIHVPVGFVTAALGGEVEVETLDNKEKLRIAPGTQGSEEIRLKGKGLPELNRNRTGDLIAHVQIAVPKKLNKKQKELLQEFEKNNSKKVFGLF